MKIVRPEWLVESAEAGVLLPWQDYIFKVTNRLEETQGKRVAQRSLLDAYASDPKAASTSSVVLPPESNPPRKRKDPPSQESEDSLVANVSSLSSHFSESNSQPSKPGTPTKLNAAPLFTHTTAGRPLYSTDPATPEQAKRVPGYAAHKSNPHAQRAMQDPAWRAAHTSAAPDFIEGFYRNSRLHHLSMWKAELKNLVAEAQERADSGAAVGGLGGDGVQFVASDGVREGDEDDLAVKKIVKENMRGKGTGWDSAAIAPSRGVFDAAVSMRDAQLVRKAPSGKGKEIETASEVPEVERVIMHCDFDSFFVSAGLVDRPHLRGKPVVVCHSQGSQGGQASTSEICPRAA